MGQIFTNFTNLFTCSYLLRIKLFKLALIDKRLTRALSLFLPILFFSFLSFGQICESGVPTRYIDFTGANANFSWTSDAVHRSNLCCTASNPDRCIHFVITTDSTVAALNFEISSGAIPPGALYYQIDCGPQTQVGTIGCINIAGIHDLTFCKPGNNINTYTITPLTKPTFPGPKYIYIGCSDTIGVKGLVTSGITWNSIYPGVSGQYNPYLSCSSGCDTTIVTPVVGAPAYVDYQVCGMPLAGSCVSASTVCDTVRVYFLPPINVSVLPSPAIFCASDSGVLLTSSVTGGMGNYIYSWKNPSGIEVGTDSTYFATSDGNFTLTVRDSGVNSTTPCSSQTVPAPVIAVSLNIVSTTSNITCSGLCNGAINITSVTGGSGPYTYDWSDIPGIPDSTTRSGLCVGLYTLTITDSTGCKTVYNFNITAPAPLTASITSHVNATCTGGTNGSAIVSPAGGTTPYSYNWSPIGGTGSTGTNFPAGTYTVLVTDSNGCQVTDSVVITGTLNPVINIAVNDSSICPGTSTTLTASGAQTYSWTPASSLNNSTGGSVTASPNITTTYTVTGTDSIGCSSSATAQILVFPQPTILISSTNSTLCFGDSTDLTASGGSTYTWSPNIGLNETTGSTVTATPSVTTTYTVMVVDSNGCADMDSIIIIVNPAVIAVAGSGVNLCLGNNVQLSASGGISYSWSPSTGLSSTNISNPVANPTVSTTYTVIVTDGNGCTGQDSVIVTVNPVPLISGVTATFDTCGRHSAIAIVSASGGTPAFSYTWNTSPIQTTDTAISLTGGGSYQVIITDANGCTAQDSVTILDITGPAASSIGTSSRCGSNNGLIDLTVSAGSAPYTYQWSNGATTEDNSNISAGSYSVTITDAFGCSVSLNDSIINIPGATLTITPLDGTCGLNNGSINVNASGGTSPYTYNWNNGATTQNLSNLGAGIYILQFADSAGCAETDTITISVSNNSPVIAASPNQSIICTGSSTIITASGATTYTWAPATGLNATTGATVTANPGTSTTYTVIGNSSGGCSDTTTVSITIQALPTITAVAANPNVCNGSSTTLTASGASTYSWTPAATLSDSTGSVVTSSPVANTTYTVTGTDSIGCSATATVAVTNVPPPTIIVSPTNPVLCYGNSVTMYATGASSYVWTPATGLNQTTGDSVIAAPLVNVTYTIIGTDANGCTASTTNIASAVNPNPVDAGPGGSICPGGSLQLNGSGAAQYMWSPSTGLNNTSIANPIASPTVTTTYYLTGNVPTGNLITNGDFSAGNTGFQSGYNYATNLFPEGLYWVGTNPNTVHSNFFCFDHTTGTGNEMVVNGAPVPGVSVWCQTVNVVPNSLYNFSTWLQTVSPAGSPALLQFSINGVPLGSPFASAPNICNWQQFFTLWNSGNNTTANICIVNQNTIRAGNDFALDDISFAVVCQSFDSVVVVVNPPPVISVSGGDTICGSSSSMLTASGANSYTWNPNTGLSATTGSSVSASPSITTTYTITGTDANGCTANTTFVLNILPKPNLSINASSPSFCSGDSSILTASGATSYSWSPSIGLNTTTGAIVTASPAVTSTYTVTGIDANGCTNIATTVVTVFPIPTLSVTPASPTICSGSSTNLTASGAATYTWTPATDLSATTGATVTANPTVSTTYTVIGTSANGCTAQTTAAVTIGTSLSISVTPNNARICPGDSATLTASGATSYTWTPSNGLSATTGSTVNASPASTTTYIITGADAMGCTGSGMAVLRVNMLPMVMITPVNPTLCAGDSALLVASGAFSYTWNPAVRMISYDSVMVKPSVTTTYTVVGTDGNGCTASSTEIINITTPPTMAVGATDDTLCFGQGTTLTATGAVSYTWSPAFTLSSSTGSNVSAYPVDPVTTYTVVGIGGNGCVATDSVVIVSNPPVVIGINPVNPTICYGSSIALNASGASTYEWTPATGLSATTGATVTASPTATTTYTVLGRDNSGCIGFNAVIVTVGNFITLTLNTSSPAICLGDSATLSVTGALTYNWAPAASLSATTGSTVTAYPATSTTYIVTGIDAIGCTGSDTIPLLVNPLPIINASPDSFITCKGTSVYLTANGGVSYSWSPAVSSGNASRDTVVVAPLNKTIYTVTGTDANGCKNKDSVIVWAIPASQVAVSPIADTLCSGSSTILTASGSNTYSWSPTTGLNVSTGAFILATPPASTTYTVTSTDVNGCQDTASTVVIVNPIPVVVVGSNPTICSGSTTPLTASGASTYTWSPATGLNNTTGSSVLANPTVNSTYIIIGTDPLGCSNFTTATVTVHPLPVMAVSSDSICSGDTVVLNATGAQTYSWTPGVISNSINFDTVRVSPSSTTTYTIVGTNANGCSNSISSIVEVLPIPVVDMEGLGTDICLSSPPVPLSVLPYGGVITGPGVYNSTFYPDSAGVGGPYTITYTYTNANGCSSHIDLLVTVHPGPSINITSNNPALCPGSSALLTASGGPSYTWFPTGVISNNGDSMTVTPSITTTYFVTGTDTFGCAATDSSIVTVNPLPVVSIVGLQPSYCSNTSSQNLMGTPAGGAFSGAGVTGNIFNPALAGNGTHTIIYSFTDTLGCSASDSAQVVVNAAPSLTVNNAAVCAGTSASLSANGATSYVWPATGDTTSTIIVSPSATSTYTVIGSTNSCFDTATSVITVNQLPTVSFTGLNLNYCSSASASTLTGTPAGGIFTGPGMSGNAFSPIAAGAGGPYTITYTYTDLLGCSNAVSHQTTVNNGAVIDVTPQSSTICLGSSTGLTATGGISYTWTPSTGLSATTGSTVTANPITNITYYVTGTDANGCSGSDSATVSIGSNLSLTLTASNNSVCSGSSTTLHVSGATNYTWTPSSGLNITTGSTVTATPASSITYLVQGSDVAGCTGQASIPITVINPPPVNVNNPSVCAGSSITLTASGATSYVWSNGGTTTSISVSPLVNTTYNVTGTSNGCSNSANAIVTVNPLPVVSFSGLNPAYCSAAPPVTLTGIPAGGSFNGTGVNGNTFNPASVPVGGPYLVTYSFSSAAGCSATATHPVSINSGAAITVTPASGSICFNSSTSLAANGGVSYTWAPSTGLSATTGAIVTANPTVSTTYTVKGTNANGCTGIATAIVNVGGTLTLTITPNNPAICAGSSTTLSASGATTYTWSPATGLNKTSGTSVTANPANTITYTITGTDAGGCTGTGTAVVVVSPLPNVNATSTGQFVCYNSSSTLSATGAANYSWSPSTGLNVTTGNKVIATPLTNITYTVTGSNAACSSSDTISVHVNVPVTLTVSQPNASICTGNSVSLNVSGASSYKWNPANGLSSSTGAAVTASPAISTTYTITGIDNNGCSGTATASVTVHALPVLSASSNSISICSGSNASLQASGASNYLWTPSTGLNATTGSNIAAHPTASITYTVTGTDANGCSVTKQVPLNVNALPVINVIANKPVICKGASTNLLASGASAYTWTPAAGLSSTTGSQVQVTPASTCTYSITGIDVNGCSALTTVVVTIQAPPTVSVSNANPSICLGQSTILIADGAQTYTWSPATGLSATTGSTITAVPANTSTYQVVGTSSLGCTGSTSTIVTVNPLPNVSVNPTNPIICNHNPVTLTANGAQYYTWAPGAGLNATTGATVFALPVATQTYIVTGTDGNGCSASATTLVTVGTGIHLQAIPTDSSLCAGQSSLIKASGATSYAWSPSIGLNTTTGSTVTAQPASTQTYTLIGTNSSGCIDTLVFKIDVNANPIVVGGPNAEICEGGSVQLNVTGSGTYSWKPSGSLSANNIANPVANPTITTAYTVQVTNSAGCSGLDTVTIKVHGKPFADAGNDTIVCFGDSIQLHGKAGTSYSWYPFDFLSNPQDQSPICKPLHNMVYTLSITDSFGCSNKDSIQIFTRMPFDVNASPGASVCSGGVVQLSATGGVTYQWTPQAGLDNPYIANPVAAPDHSTTYTVTSTDGICFTSSDTTSITVNPLPFVDASLDAEITYGQNIQLHVHSTGSVTWSPPDYLTCTDCTDPYVEHLNQPMTYVVSSTSEAGCRMEDTVHISLTCNDDVVYVPNAFTPNGDDKNDIFRVRTYGMKDITFRVFSRWGEMVFETNDINEGWDGYYKGKPCEPAVFDWYIEGTCSGGQKVLKKGNVTLIK